MQPPNVSESAPLGPSGIFLSVIEDGPSISFAAYNEESNTIIVEQSNADAFEIPDLVERVLSTIRPTLLLLPTKTVSNHRLLQILTHPQILVDDVDGNAPRGDANENRDDPLPRSTPYQVIKSSNLDVRSCKSVILKLRVKSILPRQSRARNDDRPRPDEAALSTKVTFLSASFHTVATLIDMNCKAQVQAVGSLLFFLQDTIFQHNAVITVDNIEQVRCNMFMKVPNDTLAALHIFATDYHPLVQAKGAGNAKEGYSLFSLLDHTHTSTGRKRLKEWMLKPLLDPKAIAQRQDGVEMFMQPGFRGSADNIQKLLPNAGAGLKVMQRFQKAGGQPSDFVALPRALSAALDICVILSTDILGHLTSLARQNAAVAAPPTEGAHDGSLGICDDVEAQSVARYTEYVSHLLARCHMDLTQALVDRINHIVDEDSTLETGVISIKDGCDPELDSLRLKYHQLHDIMNQVTQNLIAQKPQLQGLAQVIFFPQFGFHISIRTDPSWEVDTLPAGLNHVFTEGETLYFKCQPVTELDHSVGDVDALAKDIEAAIAAQLEDEILDLVKELSELFSALSDLECIFSFADVASQFNYVRPEVVPAEENCILIRNGGHPLQELVLAGNFVRNDVAIENDDRLQIITGPNYSGKSCFARQIGILTYMSHLGCFIPCEAARISVVDGIFAQFSAVETCTVPQSSFQLDMTRMGGIMTRVSPQSLVIIDEFGKGTSPSSGIALLAAALRKLSKSGCKVVCTTHFLEIFSMNLIQVGSDGFAALQMAIQVPESSDGIAQPLFILKDGIAESSAGILCAKMSGVKQSVVERAEDIVACMKEGRKIKPLREILNQEFKCEEPIKAVLKQYFETNLKEASKKDIMALRDRLRALKN